MRLDRHGLLALTIIWVSLLAGLGVAVAGEGPVLRVGLLLSGFEPSYGQVEQAFLAGMRDRLRRGPEPDGRASLRAPAAPAHGCPCQGPGGTEPRCDRHRLHRLDTSGAAGNDPHPDRHGQRRRPGRAGLREEPGEARHERDRAVEPVPRANAQDAGTASRGRAAGPAHCRPRQHAEHGARASVDQRGHRGAIAQDRSRTRRDARTGGVHAGAERLASARANAVFVLPDDPALHNLALVWSPG